MVKSRASETGPPFPSSLARICLPCVWSIPCKLPVPSSEISAPPHFLHYPKPSHMPNVASPAFVNSPSTRIKILVFSCQSVSVDLTIHPARRTQKVGGKAFIDA